MNFSKKQNVQIVSTEALKAVVILCNGHGAAVWHFLRNEDWLTGCSLTGVSLNDPTRLKKN